MKLSKRSNSFSSFVSLFEKQTFLLQLQNFTVKAKNKYLELLSSDDKNLCIFYL